jgi:shikimate kinase
MSPRVVLVGLPGAGKSSTGRRLAKILALPFADSDDLVEAAAGRAVTRIFAESGEEAFRAVEHSAVLQALADFDGVLALGGGAVGNDAVRSAIVESGVPVAALRATLETLGARVGDAHSRPLLAGDPLGRLAVLAEQRAPVYDAIATFWIETDGRTPGQVAATIAARLHEREVTP